MKKIPTAIILLLFMTLAVPAETDRTDKKPSVAGISLGVGAMIGGSVFSVYNYTQAKAQHNRYVNSAFTDNTKRLHQEIRRRDILCVVGAAAAGLGLLSVVVSF